MALRLPTETITLAHGGNTVRLRSSLQAALRLERLHSFAGCVDGVASGNITIMTDIMEAGAAYEVDVELFLFAVVADGGYTAVMKFRPQLEAFLIEAFGIDMDNLDKPSTGTPITMEQGLEALFEAATGWLGWTPRDAWDAAPAEIIVAQRGYMAKLKAIHGSADPADDPDTYTKDDLAMVEELGLDRKSVV